MSDYRIIDLQANAANGAFAREVRFTSPDDGAIVEAASDFWKQGRRRFIVRGEARQAEAVAKRLRVSHPELDAADSDENVQRRPDTVFVYVGLHGEALAKALMAHLDDTRAGIIAPRGMWHSSRLPLFLISIPKAGTHLLYELARALGYRDGIICPDFPYGGTWYCVEYSNSHTRAADFLIDTTRRAAFGNKHHPFFRSPALFIYRNPRDILVSESNWFHKSENSPLAGYLCDLTPEERMLRLIDDPWLLGTIRERVGGFIPWLNYPNVIPLSFEEMVGERGGGSDAVQLDLIWSIQLKLQADGRPTDIAGKVFNPDSPTFTEGRVGGWLRRATPQVKERFGHLPHDYLQLYGYADEPAHGAPPFPTRATEFRRRRLRLAEADFSKTPVLVETGYLDHNMVQFGSQFYAIPRGAGSVSLERLDGNKVTGILSAASLAELKATVLRRWMNVPAVVRKSWPIVGRIMRRLWPS